MIKWLKTGVVFKGLINEFFLVFCDFPFSASAIRKADICFLSFRESFVVWFCEEE